MDKIRADGFYFVTYWGKQDIGHLDKGDWYVTGSDAAMKESDFDEIRGPVVEQAKASQWISVEDNSMEFEKRYYVELESGRFCIGSWQQCSDYVRFTNNGESRGLDYWPASMRPSRYIELPE